MAMSAEEYEEHVDALLADFNFMKVVKVMDFLDWTWRGEVVTADRARAEARRMLLALAGQRVGTSLTSGGFEATIWPYRVDLRFVLESGSEPDEMGAYATMPVWGGTGLEPAVPDLSGER